MSWLSRIKNALHPRRLDRDLDEEMRYHLERRAEDLETRGLTPAGARRQAALTFGNTTALRETSRDLRLWAALDATCQDVRYAWRGLLRNPVFALTAVVSLSVAIGANTAIYSLLDAALLRPLPVVQPDRLVTLATSAANEDRFSYPLYQQLSSASGAMARLVLLGSPNRVEAQAAGADAPFENVIQQFVSPDAFDVLGISPALGRLLSSAEDHYPAPRTVVVLSYDYWRRRFALDPAVLGRPILLDGRTYSILGVARQGFSGPEPGKFVDVWLPVTLTDPGIFTNPDIRLFQILGRLAPGAGSRQLEAALQPAFHLHQSGRAASDSAMPPALRNHLLAMNLIARPGATGVSDFRRTFSRPLWILLAVSLCILLIACANVASLLLARSTARSAEMALRVSLGARRARLVRQLLTESLMIALLAGFCGWGLAAAAAPALVHMVSTPANPIRLDLALDTRVLGFCVAVCACAALFFGLLPAWQATRSCPVLALRHATGQAGRLRLGRLFVGVQVAFAFCLVTGGSGFLLSLRNLTAVDAGFDPRAVTVLTIANSSQRDRQFELLHQVQLRAAALPNVRAAATSWNAVLSGARRAQRIVLPGTPPSTREETFFRISPGYFDTLRTPLLAGRDLTFRDTEQEPVPTIVNRAFADRYFYGQSALGKEFRRDDGVRHQIIGLAADSHLDDLRSRPEPIAYMPMKPPRVFSLYVRSPLDPASVAALVERDLHQLAPGVRVRDVTSLEAVLGRTLLQEKLLAALGGAFALLGLVLAAVGLFGLLNYSVAARTREIGIRAALGAHRLSIYRLVLRDLAGLIVVGLTVGLAGSLVLQRFTQSLLFGIRPADPAVIALAAAVFLAAAALAGGLPARRAAAIDPVIALRHE